jgi:hypothetical protein
VQNVFDQLDAQSREKGEPALKAKLIDMSVEGSIILGFCRQRPRKRFTKRQKLVEWALLRHAESEARFERYATFIRANPDWSSIPMLRRRAEVRLWQEPHSAASVRRYLGGESTSSEDRPGVKREIRSAQDRDERWRERRGRPRFKASRQ